MRAGPMRHRCSLQRQGAPLDAFGQPAPAEWVELAKIWAEIRSVSGRAWLGAAAEQSSVTVEINIRYRPGVAAGMRLVEGAMIYEIVAVLPDNQRDMTKLMCKTVNANV